MRVGDIVEKRRFKRLDLSLPMRLRHISGTGKEDTIDSITANVSYNGAYVLDIDLKNLKPNDELHMTLSVPRDETRDFPFSRLTGRAKVIRVEEDGIALEFDEDISRLFVAN